MKVNWIPLSTQFLQRQQIDTPPPEQKAQWLENENEAKSRCQRGRQKVRQWLRHRHAIGVRQSLSRAPVQIHNLIIKSANGKATGLDLVSNRLLKIASPAISSQLGVIFNQCIEQGIFPDNLKIGKVVPIFKSGKRKTLGTIDLYHYCQHLQESLKDCSTGNYTNILQTITC